MEYAASTRIFEFQILFEAAVFYDMLITPKNSSCIFGGKHSCKQCFQLYSISNGMTLMQYRILESISKHVNIYAGEERNNYPSRGLTKPGK